MSCNYFNLLLLIITACQHIVLLFCPIQHIENRLRGTNTIITMYILRQHAFGTGNRFVSMILLNNHEHPDMIMTFKNAIINDITC